MVDGTNAFLRRILSKQLNIYRITSQRGLQDSDAKDFNFKNYLLCKLYTNHLQNMDAFGDIRRAMKCGQVSKYFATLSLPDPNQKSEILTQQYAHCTDLALKRYTRETRHRENDDQRTDSKRYASGCSLLCS